jgi:dephospho-CoA kinase
MKRIAVAGGIGAGKTAATDRLSSLGYEVIDADEVAHQITEPGQPAWQALRDAFGDAVLSTDQSLDRAFVAQIVFNDASALQRLNLITHGYIGREIVRRLDAATGRAVFVALPLYRPEHRDTFKFDETWAIQASPDVALARLIDHRAFSEADAKARLASQISNEDRSKLVDKVIWNNGSLAELDEQLGENLRDLGLSDE